MRLYLIRHPRPDLPPGVCYGSSDIPVKQDEIDNAIAALLPLLPASAPVFSSPLKRCTALAMPLAKALRAAQPACDTRLVELHFGEWEMREWSAIPRPEIDAWVVDFANYRPGGGESVMQAAARLHDFLEDAKALGMEDVIVVTHAGVIRLLLEIGNGLDPQAAALAAARVRRNVEYGQLLVLDCQSANTR